MAAKTPVKRKAAKRRAAPAQYGWKRLSKEDIFEMTPPTSPTLTSVIAEAQCAAEASADWDEYGACLLRRRSTRQPAPPPSRWLDSRVYFKMQLRTSRTCHLVARELLRASQV